MSSEKKFIFFVDRLLPSFEHKNLGLFAQMLTDMGWQALFVTNLTDRNKAIASFYNGKVPVYTLPVPNKGLNSLHHWRAYWFLLKSRYRTQGVWAYRGRMYVPLLFLMARLLGIKCILKLDSAGGTTWLTKKVFGQATTLAVTNRDGKSGAVESQRKITPSLYLIRLIKGGVPAVVSWIRKDLPLLLADTVLCETPELMHEMRMSGLARNPVFFPNSLPIDKFTGIEKRFLDQGIQKEEIILSVGRISRNDTMMSLKGFDVLIKAFHQVSMETPEPWRLRVVAEVEDKHAYDQLQLLIRDLCLTDRVEIVPGLYGAELYTEYHRAAIFVLASRGGEGQPNVITEAMFFRCAVIASDVGTIRAQVGKLGIVVPPGKVPELAQALAHLISNRKIRENLGALAREKVCADYSLEKNGEKIIKML